jgi:hypothetical protein
MHECNAHFCFLSISSLTSWDVTPAVREDAPPLLDGKSLPLQRLEVVEADPILDVPPKSRGVVTMHKEVMNRFRGSLAKRPLPTILPPPLL